MSVCLSVCPPARLSVCLPVYPSVCLSLTHLLIFCASFCFCLSCLCLYVCLCLYFVFSISFGLSGLDLSVCFCRSFLLLLPPSYPSHTSSFFFFSLALWHRSAVCSFALEGNAVYARIDILKRCMATDAREESRVSKVSTTYQFGDVYSPVFVTRGNTLYFVIRTSPRCLTQTGHFRIYFRAVRKGLRDALHAVHTSPLSGYVQPVGLVPDKPYGFALGIDSSHRLALPSGHVVMTSIQLMHLTSNPRCGPVLVLYSVSKGGQKSLLWKTCHWSTVTADVYTTTLLVHFRAKAFKSDRGFTLLYTFHSTPQSPRKLPSGMFNCSVSFYEDFDEHLHCNLRHECERREDEGGHCSFSSQACSGAVAVGNKCIHFYGNLFRFAGTIGSRNRLRTDSLSVSLSDKNPFQISSLVLL